MHVIFHASISKHMIYSEKYIYILSINASLFFISIYFGEQFNIYFI